ncbi:hypothetical protein Q3G72_019360 [Acer saccharum]|nr:hypothetical protein Q3G72_019360 [Acer saccharum]
MIDLDVFPRHFDGKTHCSFLISTPYHMPHRCIFKGILQLHLNHVKSTEAKRSTLDAQLTESQKRTTQLKGGKTTLEEQLAIITTALCDIEQGDASKNQALASIEREAAYKD